MKNIAAAFVKAQKGFAPALKTSSNPFFKSKYADLAACVEAVMDSLHANGIAITQFCYESDTGVIVETAFIHESGEQISCGKLHVPAAKNDPQGYGSALTYARRYSLMAACGIAPEDDDGNAASKPKAQSVPKDVWDTMTPEKQSDLQGIADTVRGLLDTDMALAMGCLGDVTDVDEKTALWSRFDSKERAKIKSYKESK
jgi:hypothetical protein